jgi:hypothetical protein
MSHGRPHKYSMNISDISDIAPQDGIPPVSWLLQNSQLPVGDHRRLPQALRDKLAEVAINQMRVLADSTEVDSHWIF